MSIIIPANSAVAGGYDVDNSVRLNIASSQTLVRTQGTATNLKKFVWSCWIKRSTLGAGQYIVQNYNSGTDQAFFYLRGTDDLRFFNRSGGADTVWVSDTLLRDVAAWYHILIKVDTTQGTDTNRLKIFINGVQDTGNGITYPGLNADMALNTASASNRHSLASTGDGNNYVGGYLSEIVLIDGTSPDYTDFGEFDEDSGIWKPIDVSGLTFGNNGYYLDFKDSANLGNDVSGGTDFTETNIGAINQSQDTCTNNFATMNYLDNYYASSVFSNGNLSLVTNSSARTWNNSTIGLTSGKYYCEMKSFGVGAGALIGIIATSPNSTTNRADDNAYAWVYLNGGSMKNDGTSQSGTWASWANNDLIGIALDLDNNKIYFSKNGTWQNTGTANPSTGTDGFAITAVSSLPASQAGNYFIMSSDDSTSNNATFNWNFGSPSFTISSGNADGNGYGNFEYAVPSGFFSICTKNLSEVLS
jgi:hypothetical protein